MNTKYNRNYISKRSSKKTSMDCWGRNFVSEICICFCTRTLRWTQLTHRLINQNKDQLGGVHVSSLVEYSMVLLRYIMNPHDVYHDIDISYHNILSDIIAIFPNLKEGLQPAKKMLIYAPLILQIMWIQGIWCLKNPPTSKQLIAISASRTWLRCLGFSYQLGNALEENVSNTTLGSSEMPK